MPIVFNDIQVPNRCGTPTLPVRETILGEVRERDMPDTAFIYDTLRTPRGKGRGGSLHGVKPVTLTVGLLHAVLERNPALDPALIDDLVLGCVTPIKDQGADIARTAVLAAGLPNPSPASR